MTAGAAPSPASVDSGRATGRLRERIARWLPGTRGPVSGDYQLGLRNIYVLPTRAGLLYLVVLAAMLLASINYGLALGYALTFLLGAVGLVGMLHTYRNLATLTLRPGRADAVFAGQLADVNLMVLNRSALERYAVSVSVPEATRREVADVAPTAEQMLRLSLPTHARGWMPLPRMRIGTRFPLGVFEAWSWWQPAQQVVVYPAPETPPCPIPAAASATGSGSGRAGCDEDMSSLRPWVAGDSPRRIAWTAMARTDSEELLSKEFEGGSAGELLLDWALTPASLGTEERLSRLTRWVLEADGSGARYCLVLPGGRTGPDSGPRHREDCLTALALHGIGPDAAGPAVTPRRATGTR